MLATRLSDFGGRAARAACPPGRSALAPARLREIVCCLELRSVPYWQCPRWYPGNVGIPKNLDSHDDPRTASAVCLRRALYLTFLTRALMSACVNPTPEHTHGKFIELLEMPSEFCLSPASPLPNKCSNMENHFPASTAAQILLLKRPKVLIGKIVLHPYKIKHMPQNTK